MTADAPLIPTHVDNIWDDHDGLELFDQFEHKERITFEAKSGGLWFARIDTEGPGYMAHTYWRVPSGSGLEATLASMLRLGCERDGGL